MSDSIKVISSCGSWSLNLDEKSGNNFWYNTTYEISVWEKHLNVDTDQVGLSDDAVWRSYIVFQLNNVFKVCSICHQPEIDEDLKICCYCSGCVHENCSEEALPENIIYKPGNAGFESFMRICFACADKSSKIIKNECLEPRRSCSVQKAITRLLTLTELPPTTIHELKRKLLDFQTPSQKTDSQMQQVKKIATDFFQSQYSLKILGKKNFPNKGGIGVVAKDNIPAFTIIGVYPGYDDFLGGEHAKIGRPTAKYSLMDLNCADYFSVVFPEFDDTFTPFINEPTPDEESNCAWIQEIDQRAGRLSVMSVREIKEGEELLIGYGPVYPRPYEYCYDAYAFHRVVESKNPICFALWRWTSTEEKDAQFVCYIAYIPETDKYIQWEEEK